MSPAACGGWMARARHFLQLRQIKAAYFPAWISFPFTLLHIISLLKIKRKGFFFFIVHLPCVSSPRSSDTRQSWCKGRSRTLQGWGQQRGRGTNLAQQQPAINGKPQSETLNVKLKSVLVVWKHTSLRLGTEMSHQIHSASSRN